MDTAEPVAFDPEEKIAALEALREFPTERETDAAEPITAIRYADPRPLNTTVAASLAQSNSGKKPGARRGRPPVCGSSRQDRRRQTVSRRALGRAVLHENHRQHVERDGGCSST